MSDARVSEAPVSEAPADEVLPPEVGGEPAHGPQEAGSTPGAEESRSHRSVPRSAAFRRFIADGWGPRPAGASAPDAAAPYAAARRAVLSGLFPGEVLVVPAGGLSVRSNDTDYRYRPHSAFAHLTGLGTDREADAVLVLHPVPGGHEAALYLRPQGSRSSEEFYADARYGELWVGPRPDLEAVAATTGIACRDIAALADDLGADLADPATRGLRVLRDADAGTTGLVDALRRAGAGTTAAAGGAGAAAQAAGTEVESAADFAVESRAGAGAGAGATAGAEADDELATALSELRLVKDAWEVEQLRLAVSASVRGFEEVVRRLPLALAHPRGERVVEAAFDGVARIEGNGVGYETISAAGDHACTLHWIRNDGPVREGDLLLLDAGVEVDSLYTADVTRTLPVSGTYSPAQREVYQAVLDAADAAFAQARPGRRFRDVHEAAMRVIADRLAQWGLLPVPAAQSLEPEGQYHRRWMAHGTSHHLGLDVHDCARARREMYLDAELRPGMVFTIEPGLYFKADDLLAPPELRGIGVRIEDDVLVTEDGCENLTAALPREPDAVERWMAALREGR